MYDHISQLLLGINFGCQKHSLMIHAGSVEHYQSYMSSFHNNEQNPARPAACNMVLLCIQELLLPEESSTSYSPMTVECLMLRCALCLLSPTSTAASGAGKYQNNFFTRQHAYFSKWQGHINKEVYPKSIQELELLFYFIFCCCLGQKIRKLSLLWRVATITDGCLPVKDIPLSVLGDSSQQKRK